VSKDDDAGAGPPGPPEREDLTSCLRALSGGEAAASTTLIPHVYRELHAIAMGCLRGQRPNHTLQPTALVNEAYLKLFNQDRVDLKDRVHFFAVAAKAMRQLLVDHARARRRKKRGGGDHREVTLDEAIAGAAGIDVDLLDMDRALDELRALDARQCQVVELRYFAGLEVEEVAAVLEVSKTTVEREWRAARAWLGQRILSRDE
jgi:RNA polymerase sigma factor (TIGR02999 family)